MVKGMRDNKKFLNGDDIDEAPQLFIGAAANPFAEPFEFRVHRLAKKIEAGADFIQTQCIYDMKRFREWMKQANDMGLTEKVYILAGVTPLKSGGMARYMAKNVSGIIIPDEIIDRIVNAKKAAEEGIKICVEQIEELREMKGVRGVHLMAIEWEHKVPEIAERAKLIPETSGLTPNWPTGTRKAHARMMAEKDLKNKERFMYGFYSGTVDIDCFSYVYSRADISVYPIFQIDQKKRMGLPSRWK